MVRSKCSHVDQSQLWQDTHTVCKVTRYTPLLPVSSIVEMLNYSTWGLTNTLIHPVGAPKRKTILLLMLGNHFNRWYLAINPHFRKNQPQLELQDQLTLNHRVCQCGESGPWMLKGVITNLLKVKRLQGSVMKDQGFLLQAHRAPLCRLQPLRAAERSHVDCQHFPVL